MVYDTDGLDSNMNNHGIYKNYGGYRPSDLAAYLGLPIKNKFLGTLASGATISALPFYAYCQV
ncbi:MAG: hypothetical protein H9W80_00025 [Enterococcus sp.]|nr:hypothetical protein [Enterococcus sp.]